MSKETISEQGIALLNVLTPRQKEYALTLYSGREKKKSTAYILWIVFAVENKSRLLLLSRPSCEEHHLLAAMDLLYRRNLVDHRPLPHLRHGRQEE